MPLHIVKRADRKNALTIIGTIRLGSGQRIRIRQSAQSNDPKLAAEEAAILETQLLRSDWHGERRGHRSFAEAVNAYLEAEPRSNAEKKRLHRILRALGDVQLGGIDQDTVTRLRRSMLRPEPALTTITREIITPLRAVLRHAHRRGWCDTPLLDAPSSPQGRTLYMVPAEANRLITASAPHLRTLITFLLGTGARLSEALYLDWHDVDLTGARAIFWPDSTKSGKRRNVILPPRVVVALANVPHRDGAVFRRPDGQPYGDHDGYGGQIKTAWKGAIRRAGLNPEFTPHTCRHTWASWHYALHRDLLLLKQEGGWSSVTLVERYAHLLPAGHEGAIREFLGFATTRTIAA
jgi:integrase